MKLPLGSCYHLAVTVVWRFADLMGLFPFGSLYWHHKYVADMGLPLGVDQRRLPSRSFCTVILLYTLTGFLSISRFWSSVSRCRFRYIPSQTRFHRSTEPERGIQMASIPIVLMKCLVLDMTQQCKNTTIPI